MIVKVATFNKIDRDGDIFLRSSSKGKKGVAVLDNFEASKRLGYADLVVEGNDLMADIKLREGVSVSGLFPAIGFVALKSKKNNHGGKTIHEMDIYCIGLCESPNVDETIEEIK